MSYEEGVKPRKEDIAPMLRGRTFKRKLEVWSDAAETVPFDFTGWTVTLTRADGKVLKAGAGLSAHLGYILLELTAQETLAYAVGSERYTLDIEKEGESVCIVRGTFPVEDPLGRS